MPQGDDISPFTSRRITAPGTEIRNLRPNGKCFIVDWGIEYRQRGKAFRSGVGGGWGWGWAVGGGGVVSVTPSWNEAKP